MEFELVITYLPAGYQYEIFTEDNSKLYSGFCDETAEFQDRDWSAVIGEIESKHQLKIARCTFLHIGPGFTLLPAQDGQLSELMDDNTMLHRIKVYDTEYLLRYPKPSWNLELTIPCVLQHYLAYFIDKAKNQGDAFPYMAVSIVQNHLFIGVFESVQQWACYYHRFSTAYDVSFYTLSAANLHGLDQKVKLIVLDGVEYSGEIFQKLSLFFSGIIQHFREPSFENIRDLQVD